MLCIDARPTSVWDMEEKLKRKWWLPRIPEGIAGQTKCQQPDGKIADSLSDVLISVAS